MPVNINSEIAILIEEIKNNKTDGASELARQAVKVLKIAAEQSQAYNTKEFLLEQKEVGKRLISARPSMAPITNIVSSLLSTLIRKNAGMDLDSIRELAISEADGLVADSLKAISEIARHSSGLIDDGDRIMTHSYSSTVVAVLKGVFTKHKNIEVITTKSGPGRTGERIAQELGSHGIPLTFIDDSAVGLYISTANKVIVGADRVCADGTVVNGIGTYQLALASERAKIPFYVLCETLKFDSGLRSDRVELEDKEPSELVGAANLPPDVRILNPHFDITPLELVTAVVTENGLLTAEKLSKAWEDIRFGKA